MITRRTVIGIVAVLAIVLGLFLSFANEGDHNNIGGILVRVGLMLGAIWLAYPVLQTDDGQQSLWMIAVLIGLVLFVAARPRLFVWMVTVLGLVCAANWLLKKISSSV